MIQSIHRIIGLSPFESPDVELIVALARAGALGTLDLGHDERVARTALDALARRLSTPFGVRVPEHLDPSGIVLPPHVQAVVVPASSRRFAWGDRTVLAQVRTVDEARDAIAGGVTGLIVKGHEAGGAVSDETSFVLLQRVLSETHAPVWVQGGIGLHTAAACVAAGARGVVIDSQLALLEEACTSDALRRAVSAMDGSETVVAGGYRVYARPGARNRELGAGSERIFEQLGAADPEHQLVALGQDASFARSFAERFGTVERLVRAIQMAIEGHTRQARALRPLARRSPLAEALGTEFPVVQGPMTRVSDRAAFAEAVARGGGLPFVALSLMRGAEARSLLEDTRARLGRRPWGVGVLGFAPAELREEQVALLNELRPPFALMAGGRPSLSEPLERAGIPTFLHVPSPALLEQFLKEGARRFVLEGRECGGHVGPRSSFVLWEAAVERLLACSRLDDVSVLFAGGVHDARSASMVSLLAAPLAVRGAKVGVLMGTAYLFTEEAVACGAIGAAFQDMAVHCERTVLLETAPGHAVRCVANEYVRVFERERALLEAQGMDAREAWAALERLNLGRLRVAAKGTRRDGSRLVEVDDAEQRREGMFMIGQVGALRRTTCTIEELHRDVSDGSTARLDAMVPSPAETFRGSRPIDVAIVGMACMYPDAPDITRFWTNVVLGHDAIREVDRQRWDPDLYFAAGGTGEKTPSKWGGFLPEMLFDPGTYGIPPRSLAAIEPVQLLALEVARRALQDAGYANRPFDREHASVVFGAGAGADLANAYIFRANFPRYFGALPPELDACLPKMTEDSFPGVLANIIAGRIANRLDLRGVNFTVDAACASSLAAVGIACSELASGASDLVVAGGADVHNGIYDYLMFASVHALSPAGKSRPFDARADGIVLGEGVAALVLKRLADAERDGDRIYAVLKAVGASSDGKSLGLTAPRKEGQIRALERAYAGAGLSPADVGLFEAHGTGTVVGDRTELTALNEFFGAAGALPRSCTLGSVKSQIGHTKSAAGMAGLIKAALAVHHGVFPPTNNVETPNPAYDVATSPFVLRDTAAAWLSSKRVAAVSASGFGGTNFHAVLASHGPERGAPGLTEWPAELFVVRGAEQADALELLDLLDGLAAAEVPPKLGDLAASLAAVNHGAPFRHAIVASSLQDLRAKIAAARAGRAIEGVHRAEPIEGKIAFLFPGQGSQRPGMLAELFVAFPELRAFLEPGRAWLDSLFPGQAFTLEARTAQQRAISDTRVAQPVLGIVDLAMAHLLSRVGVHPAMAAGHSYGELAALAAAGAFDAETLLALSETRARCMLDAAGEAPGTMAAVRGSIGRVREVLTGDTEVALANHNAPDQVVISGPDEAVSRACSRLADAGLTARAIPVACAFHSSVVAPAQEAFAERLAAIALRPLAFPVYANSTARPYEGSSDEVRGTLAAQLALPVRFVEMIEAMYAAGARIFVEAGPGGVLTDLVGRILRGRQHVAIACDRSDSHGISAFLSALARLIAAGVEVDAEWLFSGRAVSSSLHALREGLVAPSTAWVVSGGGARPLHGEPPEFAMRPLAGPLALGAPGGEREVVVREYLQAMRDLVEKQRQVMFAYLGDGAGAPPLELHPEPPSPAPSQPFAAPLQSGAPGSAAPTPLEALLAAISERTGYPTAMLDPNLDLEADLGIDSIKRVEILGTIGERLHLAKDGNGVSSMLDELASAKTLSAMASILAARTQRSSESSRASADADAGAGAPAASREPAPPDATPAARGTVPVVLRYVPEVALASPVGPNGSSSSIQGMLFAIAPDCLGIAPKLAELLERQGARPRLLEANESLGEVDALVQLETIAAESPGAVRALFARAKEATQANARWLLAATGLGGRFGHDPQSGDRPVAVGGVSGLLKSLAKEQPSLRVRVVDLHPGEDPARLAEHVFHELVATDGLLEVGYREGERHTLIAAARPPSAPSAAPIEIDENSVVLVTGGARGITALIGRAMARRYRCTLELVGRSAGLDAEDEDEELRTIADEPTIRRLLAERMSRTAPVTPAAVEQRCRQIVAAREIRATLEAMREAGARVEYHCADVRDPRGFGALIDRLLVKHGRIDGVLHGAGLIEDKLLRDKTLESFDRVFSTKFAGASVLARKLAHDARFFVLFSSVAGAFGSRGQTDYAAANDALDKLAHHLHNTMRGRVLSIGWGPWRGVGMVRPELEREYQRRGIALISPEAGVEGFFRELLSGSDPQVILTAASAEALA